MDAATFLKLLTDQESSITKKLNTNLAKGNWHDAADHAANLLLLAQLKKRVVEIGTNDADQRLRKDMTGSPTS